MIKIDKDSYFSQLKEKVLLESALDEFIYLDEVTWTEFFNGAGDLAKSGISKIGELVNKGIDGIGSFFTGVPYGQGTNPGLLQGWVQKAQSVLLDPKNGPEKIARYGAGAGAIIAGIYLIKKFMNRKNKNDKIDAETIKRAQSLSKLSAQEAQKTINGMM